MDLFNGLVVGTLYGWKTSHKLVFSRTQPYEHDSVGSHYRSREDSWVCGESINRVIVSRDSRNSPKGPRSKVLHGKMEKTVVT